MKLSTLALAALIPLGALATAPTPQVESSSITIHLLGHAIGTERYVIATDVAQLTLLDTFTYVDRGGRTQLTTELRLSPKYDFRYLRSVGRSYRFVNVDAEVTNEGARTRVRSLGDTTSFATPRAFFGVASYAPLAAQALLVRYWETHGRPSEILTAPGEPQAVARIERRGADTTFRVDGRPVKLRRYSIQGVAWGREVLWADDAGRFAAIVTRANMLPLEGVRSDLAPIFENLRRIAIADQMEDLARAGVLEKPVTRSTFALVGARIVRGTNAPPIEDGVVVVDNGIIIGAGPRASVTIPPRAQLVDATGTTVVPGLWDMHAHIATPEWGAAYLGVGVTTARDMGGEHDFVVALRNALAAGKGLGPRLLLAGLVDGSGPDAFGTTWADTPDEGRRVVERYHADGFQQIKLYTLIKADVAGAIIRRAHELGMTVTGHVPRAMTLESMADSGADNVAHMPVRGDPASDATQRQIRMLATHHMAVDPTLSWGELLGRSQTTPLASFQPGFTGAPWPILAAYGSIRNAGDSAAINRGVRAQSVLVKTLVDAGVPVVAGTDYGIPGFSLLRELELYVEGGMTPLEAIRSATAVPATVMRLDSQVGTIEVGKRADLLVLEANPLTDIHNIRTGRWVVSAGRMYECRYLRASVGWRLPGVLTGVNR